MKTKSENGSPNAGALANRGSRAKIDGDGLTVRQARFAHEYVKDLSPSKAALRAGYKSKAITVCAARLMNNQGIAAAIKKHTERIAARIDLDAQTVLSELWNIARADANELIQHRIGACRHCHGKDFLPMETPHERRERFKLHEREGQKKLARYDDDGLPPLDEKAADKVKRREEKRAEKLAEWIASFEERGGVGFDRTRAPNPDCPECNGIGKGYAYVVDTRLLENGARSIYAGVKETRDGVEIKMHSKERALELLGDHFGLFKQAAPPPLLPGTFNQQNNLYAISTAELYRLLEKEIAHDGNSAPGTGTG